MNSGNKQTELFDKSEELLVKDWGKTLIVAPHQDDESLGCGGTIALLRKAGTEVHIIFTSDGSMSHPNSRQYPTDRLVALREQEALAALQTLGVNESAVRFMRMKDSQVPGKETAGFDEAVQQFLHLLNEIQPNTVLVPWRRDPHKDHQATAAIVEAAMVQLNTLPRLLEYLIWLWERGEVNEFPQSEEAKLWRVNIESVMHLKQQAIKAHLSQTTRLINDDPNGFILSPKVLAHFDSGYELFAEMKKAGRSNKNSPKN